MDALALLLLGIALHAAPVAKPEAVLAEGAKVLQRLEADLDGDGNKELVLVGGVEYTPGPGRSFSGDIEVHVLVPVAGGWRDAGKLELGGVFRPVIVGDVGEGKERVTLLLAAAGQCGASCSSVEVIAGSLRGGKLLAIGDPTEPLALFKGSAILFRGKFLETWTREDDERPIVECCPPAFRVERRVVRGNAWVTVEAATVLAEEQRRGDWLEARDSAPGPIVTKEILAARDWLIRPGRSVGKVQLGLDVKSVHALLGTPVEQRSTSTAGRSVHRWGDRNPLLIWFDEGRVVQIAVTSPRFRTGRGLAPGASLADLRKEFSEQSTRSTHVAGLLDTFSGVAFLMAPTDGKVRAIAIHGDDAEAIPFEVP